VSELAHEQVWSNFKNEAARFQGRDGADYQRALHRVWDVMCRLQSSESDAVIPAVAADVLTNADELTAADLAQRRVLCPECSLKVFVSWQEGWDGHAEHACTIAGATPAERKTNYKQRYRKLFQ